MKIYTSYFGNKSIPEHLLRVSISRFPPKSWKGICLPELAPSPALFAHKNDYETFTLLFTQELLSKPLKSILEGLSNYPQDIVLLCYEKKGDFCHRNIIRSIAKEMGFDIQEL